MQLPREEALRIAERCKRLLEEKFKVKAYIFGSVRGDSPFHEGSDIDIAVEGLPSEMFGKAYMAIEEVVPAGVEVDLVLLEEAPFELVAYVKGERGMPKESREALRQQVGDELRVLKGVVGEMKRFLAGIEEFPEYGRKYVGGKLLHDFYQHIERIMERICVWLEGGVPSGEEWHKRLLERMTKQIEGVRPSLLNLRLARRLEKFLKFRHRFRYTPGFELEWEKIRPLLEGAPEVLEEIKGALERFFSKLGGREGSEVRLAREEA